MNLLNYDLELERVVQGIEENDASLVCLHLPEGLRPKAIEIQRHVKEHTDADVLIWSGSNYGACDLPVDVERTGADLIVHFGHSAWLS
jgi:diphthamide biosynthesis enzyme Dph1/Dph2-like protein